MIRLANIMEVSSDLGHHENFVFKQLFRHRLFDGIFGEILHYGMRGKRRVDSR